MSDINESLREIVESIFCDGRDWKDSDYSKDKHIKLIDKAIQQIKQAFRELVPEKIEDFTYANGRNFYGGDCVGGFNLCREEILERLR